MENLEMGAYTEAGRRDWTGNLERILTWLPVLAEGSSRALRADDRVRQAYLGM